MDVTDAQSIEIIDSSQISEARRTIAQLALHYGLSQKKVDELAIVCTELGTNFIKHTKGGTLIVQGLHSLREDNIGLEIFAFDKGPGMENVESCLKDGYSTAGTLGTGMGAISRLSQTMNICSSYKLGTTIHLQIWQKELQSSSNFSVSGITVPLKGEAVSGDKFQVEETDNGLYCLLVDGLGHGFEAAEAAKLAVKRFKENLQLAPAAMLKVLHNALRGSRGAVGAVAQIDRGRSTLLYAGLGNISGLITVDDDRKHLTSLNGTLGYEARKINEYSFSFPERATLVMHSDGLTSKTFEDLDLKDNPINKASSLLAAGLYQRHTKHTDDATVLVVSPAGAR